MCTRPLTSPFSLRAPRLALISSLAAVDPIVPAPVPPAPFYLDATHFHSNLRASDLKDSVEEALCACGGSLVGDFDVDACTWKVARFVQNRSIDMSVQLFSSATAGGPLVVEVARRRGDAFDFDGFYSDVLAHLASRRALCSATGGAALAAVRPRAPRSPQRRSPAAPVMPTDALVPLLGMLKAPFVDVQSEAARETANLAADARNHDAIVDSGVAGRLIELILSSETDVHRCAVAALSKLVVDARCAAMLREASVLRALRAVAGSEAGSAHEVGREAAQQIISRLAMRD